MRVCRRSDCDVLACICSVFVVAKWEGGREMARSQPALNQRDPAAQPLTRSEAKSRPSSPVRGRQQQQQVQSLEQTQA